MAKKHSCPHCERNFGSKGALRQHCDDKHADKQLFSSNTKKWIKRGVGTALLVGVAALIVWGLMAGSKSLPPTTMAGHIEQSPDSHVLKEPMPLVVHKHMLEHADGEGPPGIIINYNCEDYACASDLVGKLEAYAEAYPENVYVAPYPNMDAKVVLTKLGERKVLEGYDNETITAFIEG